ncbi:hypothetical protein PC128_g27135 [Phytophthora cactorum]|uniref:Uncharacterized protein n=1 Tax=Phytophthora cactorum TaxID=29920 RepID=A0A8T1BTL3_9STRA|nr:hypothetical protein PC117_g19617 [Phytophthora cactorum]KAG3127116.1 hypothetical protein PC128_g27135 [Phytophthora cactorum]
MSNGPLILERPVDAPLQKSGFPLMIASHSKVDPKETVPASTRRRYRRRRH